MTDRGSPSSTCNFHMEKERANDYAFKLLKGRQFHTENCFMYQKLHFTMQEIVFNNKIPTKYN